MKWDKFFRFGLAILFLWTSLALAAPAARAASDTTLPGSALWEPYLQQSRIDLEDAVSSPWETLKSFLPQSLGAMVQQMARDYTSVLLFLTLTAVLGLLAGECADSDLLDLAAAGGCGVLLWGNLVEEAQTLCAQMESWRSFLLGFLPVYAGVLTMGGEAAAGSAASGTLLTALCFLAQLAAAFVQPLLHCYLMLSMACCISAEPALGVFCKGVGSALRQALGWAGKLLVALLGLQRAAAFQLDRFSLRTGQLLAGSVPIIGQTLSSASESILAGVQMLKSGLGLAALSVLGAEFVPLYLGLMIQLALLMGCSLLCSLRDRRWFVMQALERAAAVFCTACICAELAARFVGPGWGQKCIKAVAGLYILVAFADALPGAKAQLTAPKLPQAETASVGSLEDAILAQTEEELSRRLEDACLREAGIRVKLRITLCRTAEGVAASAVQVVPQGTLTDARKQAVERLLTAQLQLEPESICWGEAVP